MKILCRESVMVDGRMAGWIEYGRDHGWNRYILRVKYRGRRPLETFLDPEERPLALMCQVQYFRDSITRGHRSLQVIA